MGWVKVAILDLVRLLVEGWVLGLGLGLAWALESVLA